MPGERGRSRAGQGGMGAGGESSPLGMGILEVIGWHVEEEREVPEVTGRHTGPGETDGCMQGSWKYIQEEL